MGRACIRGHFSRGEDPTRNSTTAREPHSSRLPLLHLNASDGRKMHAIFSMWECFIVRVRVYECADREGSRGILEERGVSRTMIKISNKIRELREIDTFVTWSFPIFSARAKIFFAICHLRCIYTSMKICFDFTDIYFLLLFLFFFKDEELFNKEEYIFHTKEE